MRAERQTTGLRVDDLTPRETALLCAVRAIAIGHGDCDLIRGLFAHYGRDPDGALAHLLAFVRLIGWRGARPLDLNLPGSLGISEDEILMLEALAAAHEAIGQAGAVRLEGAVAALMGGRADACVAAAAVGFARAFVQPGRARAAPVVSKAYACG